MICQHHCKNDYKKILLQIKSLYFKNSLLMQCCFFVIKVVSTQKKDISVCGKCCLLPESSETKAENKTLECGVLVAMAIS